MFGRRAGLGSVRTFLVGATLRRLSPVPSSVCESSPLGDSVFSERERSIATPTANTAVEAIRDPNGGVIRNEIGNKATKNRPHEARKQRRQDVTYPDPSRGTGTHRFTS
jgi:hypothetical protein